MKTLEAILRGLKRKIAFSIFEVSLRGIKPIYPAAKAELVQLAALNSFQSNVLQLNSSSTHKQS